MTLSMHSSDYELHGFHLRSEVPLGVPFCRGTGLDLEVFWGLCKAVADHVPAGDLIQEHRFADGAGYACSRTDLGYTVRFYGLCEFRVDSFLRRISVHLNPGKDPRWAPLLLTGNVLSMILILSARSVLHASAVEIDDAGLAFVGGSGMGKSTLATLFCLQGGKLITDDVLRVEFKADQLHCFPGAVATRLRPTAADLAKIFGGETRERTVDERYEVTLANTCATSPVLRTIVIPRLSDAATRVRVERLCLKDSLLGLLSYPRILGLQERELLRSQFEGMAKIARTLKIYRAYIPRALRLERDLPDQIWAQLN